MRNWPKPANLGIGNWGKWGKRAKRRHRNWIADRSESVREGTYFIFELRTWEQLVFKSNKYHNALFLNVSLAEDFLLYTAYSILRSEARFRSV